jgi:hypothetical protein
MTNHYETIMDELKIHLAELNSKIAHLMERL